MADVANQVSRDRCERCKQRECICGVHAFELGALMMSVGSYLHGEIGLAGLGKAYSELAKRVPGQYCNGCDVCPPVNT